MTVIQISIGAHDTVKTFGTRRGGLKKKNTNGGYRNCSIIEVDQNTEKSPEHLKRLAVTQTPRRKYRLTLVFRTVKAVDNNQQKKRTSIIVDFAVTADHRIKLKECEKKDKYLDLARELKKLWNMQVTIIPIVIGAFGTVTKGLQKGLEQLEVGGRVETIQTTALLRTVRILRTFLETWGDLLSLKLQ